MNIKDVPESVQVPSNILESIFNHQRELMDKYHDIEAANGVLLTSSIPVDINTVLGQHRLKDFMWRTTEELTEAYEALEPIINLAWDHDLPNTLLEHAKEELADALHFFVELSILSNIPHEFYAKPFLESFDQISLFPMNIKDLFWDTHYNLGRAANKLKQKAWKRTHHLVDSSLYNSYLHYAFTSLMILFRGLGCDRADVYRLYFRKNQVNNFRINSNY